MTVTPVADPCVGNLASPVNSSYFTKAFLNALPAYRPSLPSPSASPLFSHIVGFARLHAPAERSTDRMLRSPKS